MRSRWISAMGLVGDLLIGAALIDQGLISLAVNAGEEFEQVEAFAEELELTFPVLLDPGEIVQRQYRIRG